VGARGECFVCLPPVADHHPGDGLQHPTVQRSRKPPFGVNMEHGVHGGRCAVNPGEAAGTKPGLINMSHATGGDSLSDQCDSVGQQDGRFLPQGGRPPSRNRDLEQILKHGGGAGDRQVVHVHKVSADRVQPRPVGHRAFHLGREHPGGDNVTWAQFLDPLMFHRFHLDRWHINDLPLRANTPGTKCSELPQPRQLVGSWRRIRSGLDVIGKEAPALPASFPCGL